MKTLAQLVRIYKVATVTAISEMVGMDGTPPASQLVDALIEAGVKAVADAIFAEADLCKHGNRIDTEGCWDCVNAQLNEKG
jgi:hypothetical protein